MSGRRPRRRGPRRARTSGAVARVGTPGIVQNVQVAERGPTSFKITWSPPAGNGGEPLTGYGLLIWHEDTTQPPYDQAASIGVTDNHTFTGLQPSNTYNFRIHACNGTDSCGWWTAVLEATTTAATPAPGVPTAPHSILSDQIGANSFRVRWSPHAETGGSALTRFGILVRQSGSSWDESRTVWVNANPPHRYSVTGLDAGTTYVVKIKSCNGAGGQSSCSAWSSDHRVTTTAVETNPGTRPVQATPIAPECPYTDSGKTTWGPPQDLDVTPHEGREITLCWREVMDAESYTVSATTSPTGNSPSFMDVKTFDEHGILTSITDSKVVIRLDDIFASQADTGLGQNKAYGFKVTAKKMGTTTTAESDMIIIIDTTITKADGKSASGEGNGKVLVEWNSVGDILGDAYSEGEYDLRHRKSLATYNAYSPRITDFFETTGAPEENKASPFAIRNLATNAVYGIQLVYRAEGPSTDTADDDIWVFAARDAYAWVSDQPIPDNSRVAGVPVTGRVTDKTFSYKICTATFVLDGRVESWVSLITAAFDRWQAAVTTDLITIERDTDPCPEYHTVASDILDHYEILKMSSVFSDYSHVELVGLVEHFIDTAIGRRVLRLQFDDLATNEVKMFNDVEGVEGYLKEEDVFPEIASAIGHRTKCWYKRMNNVWVFQDKQLMCYAPSVGQVVLGDGSVEQVASGDIFIRRSKFKSDALLRPNSDARFNSCGSVTLNDDDNSAYKAFLHEVGHALGIGGTAPAHTEGAKKDPGHSEDDVTSVVNTAADSWDCSPYPADIMALYALYQTR